MDEIRLNLGAGEKPLDGYTSLDGMNGDVIYPLEYDDDSVDVIRASHVLEHFSHRATQQVVNEWVRCLKPGGTLRLAVPNFDTVVNGYMRGASGPHEAFIMGGHVDDRDHHGAIFNRDKLKSHMKLAGLACITEWESELDDCASYPISLNLEGRKFRYTREQLQKDVVGCITRPRHTMTAGADCLAELRGTLGITVKRSGGVFWTQGMEKVIANVLNGTDCKYVLTLDYDSIFHPEDVVELYATMELNPHIKALVPVETRSGGETVLMTVADDDGQVLSEVPAEWIRKHLMKIRSGHFGLSLIRREVFENTPRPWFFPKCSDNPDDPWDEHRCDADVSFWLQQDGGIYMANNVVIGHVQEVVTWPSKHLEPIHQYIDEYHKHGKPNGVLS